MTNPTDPLVFVRMPLSEAQKQGYTLSTDDVPESGFVAGPDAVPVEAISLRDDAFTRLLSYARVVAHEGEPAFFGVDRALTSTATHFRTLLREAIYSLDIVLTETEDMILQSCIAINRTLMPTVPSRSFELALENLRHALKVDYLSSLPEVVRTSEPETKIVEEVVDPYADQPRLYILMRDDLASMNPGKAVAQGSHAANQMAWEILFGTNVDSIEDFLNRVDMLRDQVAAIRDFEHAQYEPVLKTFIEWSIEAKGFGTCIVLSGDEKTVRSTIDAAAPPVLNRGFHSGITHDPSYPVRDGRAFYHVPLDTCAFVFGRKADVAPLVKNHSLMA